MMSYRDVVPAAPDARGDPLDGQSRRSADKREKGGTRSRLHEALDARRERASDWSVVSNAKLARRRPANPRCVRKCGPPHDPD
jgi:hypothetical protein